MWIIERDTTNPRATDEDRAMAHVTYGHVESHDRARQAMVKEVRQELQELVNESGRYFSSKAVTRLAMILGNLIQDPAADSAESGGLRFRIREYKN